MAKEKVGNTEVEWRSAEMGSVRRRLTQPQKDCQHQDMFLPLLLAENIRQEAFVFFQMIWMGLHLKFNLNSDVLDS
jgi:hypothetical protein